MASERSATVPTTVPATVPTTVPEDPIPRGVGLPTRDEGGVKGEEGLSTTVATVPEGSGRDGSSVAVAGRLGGLREGTREAWADLPFRDGSDGSGRVRTVASLARRVVGRPLTVAAR